MSDTQITRHPLLPATRMVAPAAIAIATICAALAGNSGTRILYAGIALGAAMLWALTRWRRPVLTVDEGGYRVTVGKRERLAVRFEEVKKVRALPAERAMYLDCGDPARNLLVPPWRGYGFRFQDQDALYDRLATRLADRIEIVTALAPEPPPTPDPAKPTP